MDTKHSDFLIRGKWSIGAGYAALALGIAACASHHTETRAASPSAQTASAPATHSDPAATRRERETTIQISKAVRDRCKLPEQPQEAPRFDYNQATLHAQGRNVLDDVANCLIDGPLNKEVITLVGRTDERGTEHYNESLGEGRAAAARNYLTRRGVPADRIRIVSRGEQGARGNDETTYALDRRVDLELGDLRNSPILAGSMLQAETSQATVPRNSEAASYADTAEGGKPVGTAGTMPSSQAGSATGSNTTSGSNGSAAGSVKASGSVNAGTGK
jgi:peptidoglycan-associated lipoprotein